MDIFFKRDINIFLKRKGHHTNVRYRSDHWLVVI